MICPKCGSKARCTDSVQTGEVRRRRYRCLGCGERFGTVEGYQAPAPKRSACDSCLLRKDALALCRTCKLAIAAEQFKTKH